MTRSEVILWQHLKGKQMNSYDFDRQRPIDEYVVDFYCKKLKLAIEVDGSSHDSEEAQEQDCYRQQRLEALGVRFLRFRDEEVRHNVEAVLEAIAT
ncbi:endonuclease domain-containing protein [Thermosynechococcus sp. CL-1]|uniref:endonuclease domain-containing protein n=1 Tax=Thermosynechococcus sp. CL-1 TaxID=2583530 RepID=UPI0021040537